MSARSKDYIVPRDHTDALRILHQAGSEVFPLAGGTDVMPRLNAGGPAPGVPVALSDLPELTGLERGPDSVRIGALTTYRGLGDAPFAPALGEAGRCVGSPQVRNQGTLGGALGTASATGDVHPVLVALDARIELESVSGVRSVPARGFFRGAGRTVRQPHELVNAVHVRRWPGPQRFTRLARRAANASGLCSFALALDPGSGVVGTGVGGGAGSAVRAGDAESFLAGELAAGGHWTSGRAPSPAAVERFGALVAAVVGTDRPFTRRVLDVSARRLLVQVWDEYREARWT